MRVRAQYAWGGLRCAGHCAAAADACKYVNLNVRINVQRQICTVWKMSGSLEGLARDAHHLETAWWMHEVNGHAAFVYSQQLVTGYSFHVVSAVSFKSFGLFPAAVPFIRTLLAIQTFCCHHQRDLVQCDRIVPTLKYYFELVVGVCIQSI